MEHHRESLPQWNSNEKARKIAEKANKKHVYFGIYGHTEAGDGQAPVSLGKWGTDDAPDWPEVLEDAGIEEPNTFNILILAAYPLSSGKLVSDGGIENHTWGEVKGEVR